MNKKSGVDLYREIASNEMTSLDDLFSKLEDRAPQGMLGLRLQFLSGVATGLNAAGLINESEENLLLEIQQYNDNMYRSENSI